MKTTNKMNCKASAYTTWCKFQHTRLQVNKLKQHYLPFIKNLYSMSKLMRKEKIPIMNRENRLRPIIPHVNKLYETSSPAHTQMPPHCAIVPGKKAQACALCII